MNGIIPVLEFPLRGKWKAIRSMGHHRFAYDFARQQDGALFSASGARLLFGNPPLATSFSWGQSVYAPADGTIIVAHDGVPDRTGLNLIAAISKVLVRSFLLAHKVREDLSVFAGNHILMEAGNVYILLAHLQQGSIQVSAGDKVSQGQRLAAIGNGGNTVAPHLHFQVNAGSDLLTSEIIDFRFSEYRIVEDGHSRQERNARPQKGETIEYIPTEGDPGGK